MSDAERESKLLLRAEALVAVAPLKEPNWDTFAARIEAALASAGPTDDSLLLPPLPDSVEDGVGGVVPQVPRSVEATSAPAATTGASPAATPVIASAPLAAEAPLPVPSPAAATAVATPRAELPADAADAVDAPGSQREGGLAELARAALARRGAKDAVSLAKESLAIASKGRGAVEPVPAAIATTIETERDRRTVPPVRRSRPFDTRGPWIGVAVAAVGLAAGFGLYVSGQRQTQVVQLPAAEVARAPAPAATVAAEEAARSRTPAVTPDMLPAEKRAQPAPEPVAVSAEELTPTMTGPGKTSGGGAVAGAERSAATSTSAGAAKPEKVVLEEEHAAKPSSPSKPSSPTGMRPAEFNANGGVSDRPSTGAAQAAVGAVLGAARSCIAGQPQASTATIQFGSSGEVSGVSVGGPAQGTPAAGCIQAALGKARVQPFAAPSFSLAVTIRPP